MASEVSVETVLGKIAHHNVDILGCVAAYGDHIYSSLPEIYDLIDVDGAMEYAANMFSMTDILEAGADPFEEIFLEFQGHSFVARRLTEGYLLLVTKPIQRRAFRKMQLGLNLFLKPLERALEANAANDTSPPATRKSNGASSRLRRVFGSLV